MKTLLSILVLLCFSAPSFAAAPICMSQDVQSGPATGGEGGNGVYLNVYGLNFGASQGSSTVTINGTAVAQYLYWGADPTGEHQQIGVQVAAATTTGTITVTTAGGSCSPGTFTVRSGHIWFFGSTIDNTTPTSCATMKAANSYSTPWGFTSTNVANTNGLYTTYRTPETYYQCFSAGDTGVFLNGSTYTFYDGRGWQGSLTWGDITATAIAPIVFMARPGGTATLGGGESVMKGIVSTGSGANYHHVFGMTLVGAGNNDSTALYPWSYSRVIGNTLQCPTCSTEAGGGIENGYSSGSAAGMEALFNNIIHISDNLTALPNGSNKQFHCVYVYGNGWEFAYNRISQSSCYNGIQVNLDSSSGAYNFAIHDNDIADANGSGVNLATIDPGSGYVQVYNNVIHHVGIKRASDGGADDPHNCIALKGSGSATGAGTVQIWGNTCFDTASILNTYSSGENESGCYQFVNAQTNVTIDLRDNVCYQPSYTYSGNYNVYFAADSNNSPSITGSNNLFYSATTPSSTTPAATYGSIANPLFINSTPCTPGCTYTNYYLQSGSPAIGDGVQVGPVYSPIGVSNAHLTWDFIRDVRATPPAIGFIEGGVAPPTSIGVQFTSQNQATSGNQIQ